MMIEGSGSGSIPLNSGSESGLHECTLSVIYTPVGPKNPFCLFYLTELCWDYKLVFSENTLEG